MKTTSIILSFLAFLPAGCVVATEPVPGPAGKKGDSGPPGKDGVPDTATIAALKTQIAVLEAKVSELEERSVDPDCPPGYTAAPQSAPSFLTNAVLCVNGADEVVKVGVKGAAFWIDRYEASIWSAFDGPTTGTQKFATNDDTDPTFPKTGQPVVQQYALSVANVVPAVNVTWFQAMAACGASGKRLPTGYEWMRAVSGTVDPGENAIAQIAKCNTISGVVRYTAQAIGDTMIESCVSTCGVEDMIGNANEWTADWYASVVDDNNGTPVDTTWPSLVGGTFSDDVITSVSSYASFPQQGYLIRSRGISKAFRPWPFVGAACLAGPVMERFTWICVPAQQTSAINWDFVALLAGNTPRSECPQS